jgi:hemolysin activation/secretion protein
MGFLDAGWLRNNNPDASANKPGLDRLVSVGLGMRFVWGSYAVTADWGRLIAGSVLPVTSGANIPQSGDQKLHINLTASF